MLLIGENIHIMSKTVSAALRERQAEPIQELVRAQVEAGMDYIDLNIGPARKNPEIMGWLVDVVQAVTDLPLSLDTTNPVAMEAGLKVCQRRPLINSASGKQESKEQMMPLAVKYDADIVISVLTDQGIPPDAAARTDAILETVAYANELGIPNERIWVDPIMFPVSADQQQVVEYLEFIKMLPDLLPDVKSTLGLSNLSNGTPQELRGILNRTFLVMIGRYGQYSAIVDAFDKKLIALDRGEMPEIVNLIYRTMDGEEIDPSSLSPKELEYYKTVKVLMNEVLYSHTWLEL